jgi:signal transduction histidine kinase
MLRVAHLRSVGAQSLRKRPPMVLALSGLVLGILWASGFPSERLVALAALYLVSMGFQTVMALRLRNEEGLSDDTLFISHTAVVTVQAGSFALTGGLDSPLVAGILGPFIGSLLVYGRSWQSLVTALYVAILMIALALLPTSWLSVVPPHPYSAALTLVAVLFSVYMLYMGVTALMDAYARAGETIERMREQVLVSATQRACSLESIGSRVAHELKNPLSAIKGLVQLLERSAADSRSRERLNVIGDEVVRMEAILRDYLSFSRPLEDLRREQVDLGEVVDDVIAVLEARAEQARVSLRRRGGGVSLLGDPRRLKEALLNLVANAIEATPAGGAVEVDMRERADGAELTIHDTGRGIPRDVLSRIGTPFFTTREGGTGLGVVLARTVIHHHGGEFKIDSDVGHGTTVTLKLPYNAPLPPPSIHVKAADSRR